MSVESGWRFLSPTHLRTNPFVLSRAGEMDERIRLVGPVRRKGFLLKLRRERILCAGGWSESVSTDFDVCSRGIDSVAGWIAPNNFDRSFKVLSSRQIPPRVLRKRFEMVEKLVCVIPAKAGIQEGTRGSGYPPSRV